MKKILLLTAALLALFSFTAFAAEGDDDPPPSTDATEVTVTVIYLGFLDFDDGGTDTTANPGFADYNTGYMVLAGANELDDTLEYWANSSSTITYSVDSDDSTDFLNASTFKHSGSATAWGNTNNTQTVAAGLATFNVENYTIDGVGDWWSNLPPGTYTVTYTATIADS